MEDFVGEDSKDLGGIYGRGLGGPTLTRTILRNKLNGRIYCAACEDGCHGNGNATTQLCGGTSVAPLLRRNRSFNGFDNSPGAALL